MSPRRREKRCEGGQTMVEYLVVLTAATLGLIATLTPLRLAIRGYMRSIYFFVGLPIP